MRMRLPSLLLLATLAACTDTSGPTPGDQIYEGNLAKWNSTGPASYQMVLTRACACTVPLEAVLVVVRNKAVESRTFTATGTAVPTVRAPDFPDVAGLFDMINRAKGGGAIAYSAEYDSALGYPVTVFVNWTAGTIADDVSYTVTDFTPLP
jgi:hypothetical protein